MKLNKDFHTEWKISPENSHQIVKGVRYTSKLPSLINDWMTTEDGEYAELSAMFEEMFDAFDKMERHIEIAKYFDWLNDLYGSVYDFVDIVQSKLIIEVSEDCECASCIREKIINSYGNA